MPTSAVHLIRAANLLAGDWTAQHGADVTHVQRSSAQWEDAPHQRQDAERVTPRDQAGDEESRARDDAKDAPRGTVNEARET